MCIRDRVVGVVCLGDDHRRQAHGAGLDAAAAMDALGHRRQLGLRARKGQHGVVLFEDGESGVHHRDAHHRAAGDDLAHLALGAATKGQHVGDGGAHDDPHVFGLGHGAAVHGQAAGGQRHAGAQIGRHKGHAGHVHHDAAHIAGQAAPGHLAAGTALDEDLLRALRVDAGQGLDGDGGVALDEAEHHVHGLGLVALDGDDDAFDVQPFLHGHDAAHHVLGVLDELAVVGGDIGLALGAVDDQGVDDRQVFHGQLNRGGKARAPQAHQSAGADGGGERLIVGHRRGGNGGVLSLIHI